MIVTIDVDGISSYVINKVWFLSSFAKLAFSKTT